ncbi:MAG: glycosyltransferase family 2 protein, partial [Thaumarchaeota archaeon]|nr:glycosyltransferase family 2 protein [Nitrososphaerota archaeon]
MAIPAYNQEKRIGAVVIGSQKLASKVLVCDDGSTDMTGEIAERLGAVLIRHRTNLGKGVAIRDLFNMAKFLGAEVIVTIDSDGQHDPRQIPLLVKPILEGTADIVNGSRFLKENRIPNHRRFGGAVLNDLSNIASHSNLTDSTSGFRAYSRTAIERIEVIDHGMGVDTQVLNEAYKHALRVVEVPIDVKYADDSSTYHPAKVGTYVILSIIRTAAERSPLLYLGLPGIISVVIGIIISLN